MLLVIKGIPKPKQSVRSRIVQGRNGGQFVAHYQTAEIKAEEANIQTQILNQLPMDFSPYNTPLAVKKLHYIFPIPSGFSKKQLEYINNGNLIYKNIKPDITDNLNKGLFDALEGILYINDSLVISMNDVKKYYGHVPQTILEIEPLEPYKY